MVPVAPDDRLRSHYESLARAVEFTRGADAKAAPVLGLQLAFIGTLAARSGKLEVILASEQWGLEEGLLALVIVLYTSAFVAAVVLAMKVYMPITPRSKKSLIYFEDIAAQDFAAFEKDAATMDVDLIEHQLLDQIHRVSKIASLKMRRVRCAFRFSVASGALWLVLLAWGSVQ